MQSSPAAQMQAANLYVFTMNNPVMWADPSGMRAREPIADDPVNPDSSGRQHRPYDGRVDWSPGPSYGGSSWGGAMAQTAALGMIVIPVPRGNGGTSPGLPVWWQPGQNQLDSIPGFPTWQQVWEASVNSFNNSFLGEWVNDILSLPNDARVLASGIRELLNRSTPSMQEELGRIAGGFGNLDCVDAAAAMQAHLEKNRRNGYVITLQFHGERSDFIISDYFMGGREAISWNGMHQGIGYNRLVHCNVFPQGKPEYQWIGSFMVANGSVPTVTRTPF